MPETFADPMAKWSPAPDWSAAEIARADLRIRPAPGLTQVLLSGDLPAAFASLRPRPEFIGLWQVAPPARAAVRMSRDRALLVSSEPFETPQGWRPGGWAASDASDAYAVFDIEGAGLRGLVAEATAADPDAGSPSAAILFAGVPALLYRLAPDKARLHLETGFAPYLWRWLETR
jgi:sarcosine oxidase gamma subunit